MAELYSLPDGWEWKKLENISKKIFAGGDKPDKVSEFKTDELNIPIYANAVKNNGLYGYSNIYKVDEECITISARGTIGFTVVRNEKFFPIVRLIVLIPNEQVLSKILKYYLDYELVENTGSSIPQLTVPTVKELFFPLPPLEEQKRIVAKLDILFEKIDKAIDLHQKNIDEADIFMASVLNDVFVELEEKHPAKSLNEVSFNIQYGYTDSAKDKGNAVFIRITDINENGKFKDNFVYINIDDKELNKFKLFKGDILVARSGATAGKVALFDLDLISVFASYLIRIQPNKEIDSSFLFYFCHSPKYWEQLNSIKVGGAQPNVNATNLKEIKIAIPPLKTQQKVVSYLDEISNKMENIKQIQKAKMQSLKELKASILDKAFKGEL
jgi:type I restriction enzyme S subunit